MPYSKGTIVIHGGYDSFVQEFIHFLFFFSRKGIQFIFSKDPDKEKFYIDERFYRISPAIRQRFLW